MLGTTALRFTMEDDEDATAMTVVGVRDSLGIYVLAPVATRASGSEVYYGTKVQLTSNTHGATIYYTLDGSCPCDDNNPAVQLYNDEEGIVITLDANGGKVSKTRLNANADGSVPALPTPQERDGYIFGGWYNDKDGGEQVFEGDILTEDVTLYAHWFELRVTITENAVVPEALKTKYASVDAMKTAMLNTVKRRLGTTTVKGNKLYELTVEYFNGSEWLPLDADLFPTKGVKVGLAIPSGAASPGGWSGSGQSSATVSAVSPT
jgi:uncharacterized repeat protein (TIGR02543 family)